MLPAMLACTILVMITIVIHYEALRLAARVVPALTFLKPRPRLIFIVAATFVAHSLEVWLWALGYWICMHWLEIGGFGGEAILDFRHMVYFSVVSYTTLGIGDIYPLDGLRLLTGVEALTGLLMIAWSASFTYLAMERHWRFGDEAVAQDRRGRRNREAQASGGTEAG